MSRNSPRSLGQGAIEANQLGAPAMTETKERSAQSGSGLVRRLLPLGAIAGLIGFVYLMGWHEYLTVTNLYESRTALKGYIASNFIAALAIYMVVYIAVVALSLPGGLLLTVTGGFLFGWMVGAPATIVAATIGATIIFLVAKTSLGDTLADRAGPWVAKLRGGFQENALSYLLFLRLVPAFPFFVVNIAPALLGVGLGTFFVGTLFGIIPGTTAFSFAGSGLDSVFEAQAPAYEACKASAADPATCKLDVDLSSLVTRELIYAFIALGFVALIPPIAKKVTGRRADASAGGGPTKE